ncbi:MAG: hypothetical protein LIO57_01615 [Oscillospiraceae bacterium]|nr:hypothetical protein [Oscillospiraceae bacterium]
MGERTPNTDGLFEITPCDNLTSVEQSKLTKLHLTSEQKASVSALIQQAPAIAAIGATAGSNLYVLKFPDGIQHTLMSLRQGGFSSTWIDSSGRTGGTASLFQVSSPSVLLGAFTAMSIASSQYFLKEIYTELGMMKASLDKILEFLYGDKKAELIAEMIFVQYAYKNYNSIMLHPEQVTATIGNLQEAKKVAMKDVEFYLSDLASTVNSKSKEIAPIVNTAFQINESLELAMQLYVASSILEVYYSQNFEPDYISYIESESTTYIGKCENRVLSYFGTLNGLVLGMKDKPLNKTDKPELEARVSKQIELLSSGEQSAMRKSLSFALEAITQIKEYYVSSSGDVYVKSA